MTFSNDSADNHLHISRRFLRQADEELSSGDHIQASEKAWGAVAHYFKSIAARRDWRQNRHRDYYVNMERLGEESPDKEEFRRFFLVADGLHANFYNDYMSPDQVSESIEDAKKLIAMLDDIESAADTRSP